MVAWIFNKINIQVNLSQLQWLLGDSKEKYYYKQNKMEINEHRETL